MDQRTTYPSGTGNPTNGEIRAALGRVIASEMLRHSPQLAAFLRFVVEATLRGESHLIKSYTIAVDALGRASDFDSRFDPIVRVEAGRLRRALERYYAGVGAMDPVTIHIPRGCYVPEFRSRQDDTRQQKSLGEGLQRWRAWLANHTRWSK